MAVVAWGSLFYGNGFYLVALAEQHGWSLSAVSFGISLSFVACIPASIAFGWVFDTHGQRYGPMAVVLYGALAMAAGIALLGRVDALWQLYLTYLLLGSAYPALAAPAISSILNLRVASGYGWSLSLALTGASVGGMISAPGLVWANGQFGLAPALGGLAGIIVLAIVPAALRVLRPPAVARVACTVPADMYGPAPKNPKRRAEWAAILFTRRFAIIAAVSFLSLAAQVGFLAHQLSVLQASLTAAHAALVVSATAVVSMVGRFLVGGLSERMRITHLAALTYLVLGVGIALVAVADVVLLLVAGCLLAGLSVGAVVMLPPMLCRAAFDSTVYGRAYGMAATCVYLGGAVGPSLAGLLADLAAGYGPALLCLCGISVAAASAVRVRGLTSVNSG